MIDDFLKQLHIDGLSDEAIRKLSPLQLAFLGDAIYDAHIRYYLMHTQARKVNDMHKRATDYVKASAQSKLFKRLQPLLSDVELGIMMRGRNHKTKTVAKNATIADYRQATGFEALIGYLSLLEDKSRLNELLKIAIEVIENPEKESAPTEGRQGDFS